MRGRIDFVNSFMSLTTKQSPAGPQLTTCAIAGSSSILKSFLTKSEVDVAPSSWCCEGGSRSRSGGSRSLECADDSRLTSLRLSRPRLESRRGGGSMLSLSRRWGQPPAWA
jgi:hypothetical protein